VSQLWWFWGWFQGNLSQFELFMNQFGATLETDKEYPKSLYQRALKGKISA